MSFKITIIDNKTGEVRVDENEAIAIIGAVGTQEGVRCLGFTECDILDLYSAISGAKDVIHHFEENHPEFETMELLHKIMSSKGEKSVDGRSAE